MTAPSGRTTRPLQALEALRQVLQGRRGGAHQGRAGAHRPGRRRLPEGSAHATPHPHPHPHPPRASTGLTPAPSPSPSPSPSPRPSRRPSSGHQGALAQRGSGGRQSSLGPRLGPSPRRGAPAEARPPPSRASPRRSRLGRRRHHAVVHDAPPKLPLALRVGREPRPTPSHGCSTIRGLRWLTPCGGLLHRARGPTCPLQLGWAGPPAVWLGPEARRGRRTRGGLRPPPEGGGEPPRSRRPAARARDPRACVPWAGSREHACHGPCGGLLEVSEGPQGTAGECRDSTRHVSAPCLACVPAKLSRVCGGGGGRLSSAVPVASREIVRGCCSAQTIRRVVVLVRRATGVRAEHIRLWSRLSGLKACQSWLGWGARPDSFMGRGRGCLPPRECLHGPSSPYCVVLRQSL